MYFFKTYNVNLFFYIYLWQYAYIFLLSVLTDIFKDFIDVVICWEHKFFLIICYIWKIVSRDKLELILIKIYLLNTINTFHHIFRNIISKNSWL